MRLTAEITYDAAPDAVFAMLTDPLFQERKCLANGALEHEVAVSARDDGGAAITTRRVLPTTDVPDFVKSFIGPTLTVAQVEDWGPVGPDGGREGELTVEITGAPVHLSGSIRLSPTAEGGTHESIEGELKASVPFLGGQIEKAAEPAIRSAIKAEQRTGTAWLAGEE